MEYILANMMLLSQVRVNKEQDHVLMSPQGLSFAEVTGANLVSKMVACVTCIVMVIVKSVIMLCISDAIFGHYALR